MSSIIDDKIKITKIDLENANREVRQGIKGPNRTYWDNGTYHNIKNGNDIQTTPNGLMLNGVTEDGKKMNSDFYKAVRHTYPEKRFNFNEVLSILKTVINIFDGNIPIQHYENSRNAWLDDEIIRNCNDFHQEYTDFHEENYDFGIGDLR